MIDDGSGLATWEGSEDLLLCSLRYSGMCDNKRILLAKASQDTSTPDLDSG